MGGCCIGGAEWDEDEDLVPTACSRTPSWHCRFLRTFVSAILTTWTKATLRAGEEMNSLMSSTWAHATWSRHVKPINTILTATARRNVALCSGRHLARDISKSLTKAKKLLLTRGVVVLDSLATRTAWTHRACSAAALRWVVEPASAQRCRSPPGGTATLQKHVFCGEEPGESQYQSRQTVIPFRADCRHDGLTQLKCFIHPGTKTAAKGGPPRERRRKKTSLLAKQPSSYQVLANTCPEDTRETARKQPQETEKQKTAAA